MCRAESDGAFLARTCNAKKRVHVLDHECLVDSHPQCCSESSKRYSMCFGQSHPWFRQSLASPPSHHAGQLF
jgi:hypothetical protein